MAADTSVKWATSDMLGAPLFNGQAGSLVALLDAVLVNGWGVQTATQLVVASGVATATFPANHAAWVNSVVLVAGSTPSVLNGEQKVTEVLPNKVRWATTAPDGTATGTITVKMAPAGWSKPFAGTNVGVYRSASPQANGHFLRVNDTGAQQARVVGYETMTAVSTGAGLFPTAAQANGGGYWLKSSAASVKPVHWALVSDARFFYFFCVPYSALDGGEEYRSPVAYYFGDPLSIAPFDPWSTVLGVNSFGNQENGGLYAFYDQQSAFMPRVASGAGTSAVAFAAPPVVQFDMGGAAPNPYSGQMAFQPAFLKPASGTSPWRAQFPGLVVSMQGFPARLLRPFQPVTFGLGAVRREQLFIGLSTSFASADASLESGICIDITGPWR